MLRLGSVLVASVLVLAACGSTAEDRAISGAGIGAAAGAIIGAITGLTARQVERRYTLVNRARR